MGTHDGRVAIVTGAGRGIGRGIAVALAKEGATVAIAELDDTSGRDAAQELESFGGSAMHQACDVRDSHQVDTFVAEVVRQFGTVDILVNNAMAAEVGIPIQDLTDESIELAFRTGPIATLYLMRACHPHLGDGGRVVNLRSSSEFQGIGGFSSYVAAKSAIGGITRAAAREWGPQGITVNAVCPLVISEAAKAYFDTDPELATAATRNLSIPRTGDAEADIGRAVVYLTGPDAGFITGCTLMVDGGGTFVA
jgi:NAD(P)-dependent dehydrogenase (short-subunit alcohol dehydrogenase family)